MKKAFVEFEEIRRKLDKLADPGRAFCYGRNKSGAPLFFDRKMFKDGGQGFILGAAGTGKKYLALTEILSILLKTEDDVVVISSGDMTYRNLAKCLNSRSQNGLISSVIDIAFGSQDCVNLMDIDIYYADEDDPVVLKSDFLISLCEVALGNRISLTPIQRSIIDRCCRLIYEPFLASRNENGERDKQLVPTFFDFYKLLEDQPEDEAKQLALCLEVYAKRFAHPTNANTDARFIVYEYPYRLSGFATLVALNSAWNRVVENCRKKRRTWIYVDDCCYLFETESSTNFVFNLWKRARMLGCTFTLMTQDVSALLNDDATRAILFSCGFMQILDITPDDRETFSEVFNSNMFNFYGQKPFPSGKGLIYDGLSLVPFSFDSFYKTIAEVGEGLA